jgi:hypothetical protein
MSNNYLQERERLLDKAEAIVQFVKEQNPKRDMTDEEGRLFDLYCDQVQALDRQQTAERDKRLAAVNARITDERQDSRQSGTEFFEPYETRAETLMASEREEIFGPEVEKF